MAEYLRSNDRIAEACDWLVAAAEKAESSDEFIPRLLSFLCVRSPNDADSWPEMFSSPSTDISPPLLAITVLRILLALAFTMDRAIENHFLSYIRKTQSDLCKGLQITDKVPLTEMLVKLRDVEAKLDEVMQDLVDATNADQLASVLNRFPRILTSVNHNVAKAITTPFLPQGYVKSILPQVLNSIVQLDSSSLSQFIDAASLAESEITRAMSRLEERPTVYVRRYHLPLMRRLEQLRRKQCEQSDATKPANLTLNVYPRKYPFHQADTAIRLRFVLLNTGPGPAADIDISFFLLADFDVTERSIQVSSLEVGQQVIEFDVRSRSPIESVEFEAVLTWNNFDGKSGHSKAVGRLQPQNPDVDWEVLISEKPYSIEAIDLESSRPFVGREADLSMLTNAIFGPSMGSAYIHGQKRVGKTSIGFELASRAQEQLTSQLYPIYLTSGDYVEPDAQASIAELGGQLATRLRDSDDAFAKVPIPEFTTSLTPLVKFVDILLKIKPDVRFLFILDEFDELPIELYKRGPVGDSFFLKLRSLSDRARVGVILIGGEKIPQVVSAQGEQLNKFDSLAVDYFHKENQWSDFEDLVRKPVDQAIEYSDSAVECIYSWTAGNPFFTNMICQNVLESCIDRRDAYVTEFEVEECARRAYTQAEQNRFAHFWEDGVLDTGLKTEEVSILRRKLFLAIAAVIRRGDELNADSVASQKAVADLPRQTIDQQLQEMIQRKILIDKDRTQLKCRVKLFERFLAERSSTLLTTDFTDAAERKRLEELETQTFVIAQELCDLLARWGQYGPRPITEERLRAWLDQFDTNQDKRLMFQLLSSLRFYNEQLVREKLAMAMATIRKKSVERRAHGEKKRRDVLVTYLGEVGKSGTQYARLFCQVNNILAQNVFSQTDFVERYMKTFSEFSAIVAVDDLLGTGESVAGALDEVNSRMGAQLRNEKVPLFIVAICGFETAITRVQDKIAELRLPVELIVCDELNDRDRAFSESSETFANSADRVRAIEIAMEKGLTLEKKSPLGFGDCEALVAFFSNCPNNSLPILYKETAEWRALFPRQ